MELGLACTLRTKKRTNHTEEQLFYGIFQGGVGGGSLVLQLLQAVQGLSTGPNKATQLDATLQGGAGAQLS